MDRSDAKALCGLLEAEFGEMPDTRAELFMDELQPFEWADGLEGVRAVLRTVRYLHLADVLEAVKEARRDRRNAEAFERDAARAVLPAGETEYLSELELAEAARSLRLRLAARATPEDSLGSAITEGMGEVENPS